MRLILVFISLCCNLLLGQTVPVISNSTNSPYRQLSLLSEDVDELRKELNELKDKQILLDEKNKNLKNGYFQEEMQKLQTSYANLEQKFEDTCRFISDIGTEKYDLMQKELQANKDFSIQIEQKILAILTDWCKQAEGKIEAKGKRIEKVDPSEYQVSKNSKERFKKKTFLSYQCKAIEEKNRMGKSRDLFKKT